MPDLIPKQELAMELLADTLEWGIGSAELRVKRANDDWLRLQQIRRQRGECPEMQHVPGGQTGLLIRSVKSVGRGDAAQLIEEYEIDHALLAELRALETQAARDIGLLYEMAGRDREWKITIIYADGPDYASQAPCGAEDD